MTCIKKEKIRKKYSIKNNTSWRLSEPRLTALKTIIALLLCCSPSAELTDSEVCTFLVNSVHVFPLRQLSQFQQRLAVRRGGRHLTSP